MTKKSAGFTLIDRRAAKRGFTLIELSIVLVIIGLIVGGILVGRDLISAAEIMREVRQIGQFNAAVNTFRTKYGGLPGDLAADSAFAAGFAPRFANELECNNNGIVEDLDQFNVALGSCFVNGTTFANFVTYGYDEGMLFWNDLGAAGLLSLSATPYVQGASAYNKLLDSTNPKTYAGPGHVFATFVSTPSPQSVYLLCSTTATTYSDYLFGTPNSLRGCKPYISAMTAYRIDQKIDDGMPTTGQTQGIDPASSCIDTTVTPNAYLLQGTAAASCYLQSNMQ